MVFKTWLLPTYEFPLPSLSAIAAILWPYIVLVEYLDRSLLLWVCVLWGYAKELMAFIAVFLFWSVEGGCLVWCGFGRRAVVSRAASAVRFGVQQNTPVPREPHD